MALSSTKTKITLQGDGVSTEFGFDFRMWETAGLKVYITNDGDETEELESGWSFELNDDQKNNPGGVVNCGLSGAPIPDSYYITIVREMDFTQRDSFYYGRGFNPEIVEDLFDRTAAQLIQLKEITDRTVKENPKNDASGVTTRTIENYISEQLNTKLVEHIRIMDAEEVGSGEASTLKGVWYPGIEGVIDQGGAGDDYLLYNLKKISDVLAANGGEIELPPGVYPVLTTLTIPDTIRVRFRMGACISVAAGARLTLNVASGPFEIFDGAGTVVCSNPVVYSEWFSDTVTNGSNELSVVSFNDLASVLIPSQDYLAAASIANAMVSQYGQVQTPAGTVNTLLETISILSKDRLFFVTKALMDADLGHDENTMAEVTADATADNNRLYIKSGASGEGSWLPCDLDRLTVAQQTIRGEYPDFGKFSQQSLINHQNLFCNAGDAGWPNDVVFSKYLVNSEGTKTVDAIDTPDDFPILSDRLPQIYQYAWDDDQHAKKIQTSVLADANAGPDIVFGFWLDYARFLELGGTSISVYYDAAWQAFGFDAIWLGKKCTVADGIDFIVDGIHGDWAHISLTWLDFSSYNSYIQFLFSGGQFYTTAGTAGDIRIGNIYGFSGSRHPNPYDPVFQDSDITLLGLARGYADQHINVVAKKTDYHMLFEQANLVYAAGETGWPQTSESAVFSLTLANASGAKTVDAIDTPDDFPVPAGDLPQVYLYAWDDDQFAKKFSIGASVNSGDDLALGWWMDYSRFLALGGATIQVYNGASFDYFDASDLSLGDYAVTASANGVVNSLGVDMVEGSWIHIIVTQTGYSAVNTTFTVKFGGGQFEKTEGTSGDIRIGNVYLLSGSLHPHPLFVPRKSSASTPFGRAREYVDNTVKGSIEPYVYGAKIQRFLKKARDYRSGRVLSQAPKIVMIGDSITGGAWAEAFKTWLCDAYSIPADNFEIHWYGGYAIDDMVPFLEDIAVFPNPDLIIFGEYEDAGSRDYRLHLIEKCIQMFRDHTTADIAIFTWSMSDTVAQAYIDDASTLIDDAQYQAFNWYRDIARVYNCELIDFNEAIRRAIDNGATVESLGMSGPHLSSDGYMAVFYPEIITHFNTSDDQRRNNQAYPLYNKEELLHLVNVVKMDLFNLQDKVSMTGTWANTSDMYLTGDVGATMDIDIKDAIGFELFYITGAAVITIDDGDGFDSPSNMAFRGRPLQYAGEIVSTTYDSPADWRYKRPFKKAVIANNMLADGVLKSGQYKITVTDVSLDGNNEQVVVCSITDPDQVEIGTFTVGTLDVAIGNLRFPLRYNDEKNYALTNLDTDNWGEPSNYNYIEGDEYEFYLYSNWVDTLSETEDAYHVSRVFGFERGDYTLRLSVTTALDLIAIKIFH